MFVNMMLNSYCSWSKRYVCLLSSILSTLMLCAIVRVATVGAWHFVFDSLHPIVYCTKDNTNFLECENLLI